MRDDFTNQRVTVMGLGRFGGGLGAARFFADRGARVLVTDLATRDQLSEPLSTLASHIASGTIALRLGEHRTEDFTAADLVVANPAVPKPWDNPYLNAARAARVPVTTEIKLLIDRLPSRDRTIAITGSAGKSTTSALIEHLLRSASRPAVLAGNIGGSLLDEISRLDPATWIVLELSSAMIHWLETLGGFSPHVAVATNLVENHIDWHGSMDHYRTSKQHLFRHQRPRDAAILGESLADWPTQPGVRRTIISSTDHLTGLRLPGAHNAWNARVALAAVLATDPSINSSILEAAARAFPGLAHRLEFIAEVRGCLWYNDSKSTTPQSTRLALDAFADKGDRRVHLIVGGYDKKADLTPLAQLAPRCAGLYTIGATGPVIDRLAPGLTTPCGDLSSAIATITPRLRAGDVVLLSPGCASWDQFPNFEARGKAFAALVRSLS